MKKGFILGHTLRVHYTKEGRSWRQELEAALHLQSERIEMNVYGHLASSSLFHLGPESKEWSHPPLEWVISPKGLNHPLIKINPLQTCLETNLIKISPGRWVTPDLFQVTINTNHSWGGRYLKILFQHINWQKSSRSREKQNNDKQELKKDGAGSDGEAEKAACFDD